MTKTFHPFRQFLITCTFLPALLFSVAYGQNLSFTLPAPILKDVKADKAPSVINFKDDFFIAWKDMQPIGNLFFIYIGKQYDTATFVAPIEIPGAKTAFAPAFSVLNDKLYLFWISDEGRLNYIFSSDGNNFNLADIHQATFTKPVAISLGITAAVIGNKILIGTHGDNKSELAYCVLQPGDDGIFKEAALQTISKGRSPTYPFVINLDSVSARFCWQGNGSLICYADYNSNTNIWSNVLIKGTAQTQIPPAVFHVWDSDKLFYIWRGYKGDTRFYYKVTKTTESLAGPTELPAWFTSDFPVSICKVDENNFLMAYTGSDSRLYLCNFCSYDPANWMEAFLHPRTSKKTLRDIIIPGSHDAGMSVLTATGGQQKGTINECNTLTQKFNIEQQLNSGIRMFDLRTGTFNKSLYAKHCASDCMEDAIGGAYGESLHNAATAIRIFLLKNKQEIILLSFSHFCERETSISGLKDSLLKWLGPELIYNSSYPAIGLVPLSQLAGKVIVTFEIPGNADKMFPSCSIGPKSDAFVNFRREYAATNEMTKLFEKEKAFFIWLDNTLAENDLIRLDWQITQSTGEAPMVCNDFEDEKLSPLINGALLLTNAIKKNKSIIDHSIEGNKYLPLKLTEWIKDGTINTRNKPNILYVDVAGAWITDFCIDLLKSSLYK